MGTSQYIFTQGHVPCECGEFTHIFSQDAMGRLPPDYSGELCPRCGLWMCRVDKLEAMQRYRMLKGCEYRSHNRRCAYRRLRWDKTLNNQ